MERIKARRTPHVFVPIEVSAALQKWREKAGMNFRGPCHYCQLSYSNEIHI